MVSCFHPLGHLKAPWLTFRWCSRSQHLLNCPDSCWKQEGGPLHKTLKYWTGQDSLKPPTGFLLRCRARAENFPARFAHWHDWIRCTFCQETWKLKLLCESKADETGNSDICLEIKIIIYYNNWHIFKFNSTDNNINR